ncbi:MAG: aminotransferase class I/II-fold pyridoxal phosphate-dependent enzyme [bacterium]
MAESFDERLSRKLENLENLDLRRDLPAVSSPQERVITVDGRQYVNFSSNDYLGLATSQEVVQRAQAVLEQHGLGSGGSRLVCGEHPLFEQLEKALASWKRTEAALSFGSGYLTSLGVLRAVLSGRDLVLYDELSHRCLLEGIELSAASSRDFNHNDVVDLERKLQEAQGDYDSVLIVTEGLFSMDGDRAPLREISDLAETYGSWLMVDEAHSAGVLGPDGAGLTTQLDRTPEVAMGTLSKAVAGYGGYVAGTQLLREFLINRATTLIYSTGLPASTVAGNLAALKQLRSTGELREKLTDKISTVSEEFSDRDIPLPDPPSQIVPLLTGDTESTLRAGDLLRDDSLYAVPIRYPTVPRNKGRVRFSLRSDHSEKDLEKLLDAVDQLDQEGLILREDIWSD